MTEIKKPFELKEGDYCYIQDRVCHVHKIRTACGEYFMAGYPIVGEKEELDHIVDCIETVKVPVVSVYKATKLEESIVTIVDKDSSRELLLQSGPILDNITNLFEEGKEVSVKVLTVDGRVKLLDSLYRYYLDFYDKFSKLILGEFLEERGLKLKIKQEVFFTTCSSFSSRAKARKALTDHSVQDVVDAHSSYSKKVELVTR